MLIGEYQHTIDAKNRVIVPAKFREDLGSLFYITKGLDGCLFVLSRKGWEQLQAKILCRCRRGGAGQAGTYFNSAKFAGICRIREGCYLYRHLYPCGNLEYGEMESNERRTHRGIHC